MSLQQGILQAHLQQTLPHHGSGHSCRLGRLLLSISCRLRWPLGVLLWLGCLLGSLGACTLLLGWQLAQRHHDFICLGCLPGTAQLSLGHAVMGIKLT
jgi:hypothetical protein